VGNLRSLSERKFPFQWVSRVLKQTLEIAVMQFLELASRQYSPIQNCSTEAHDEVQNPKSKIQNLNPLAVANLTTDI
jgi:hypothetical protein